MILVLFLSGMYKINQFLSIQNKHFLLLLMLTVLLFFPLSFHLYPMKYDAIDCFFPWRYFISSELNQGRFPFWNPYQDLGYPISADPSSGAWYPIVWIFSLFGKYSIYTISLEYLFHVFIAGIGSYLLFQHFYKRNEISLFGAIAYMTSGVFISNAQHLPYIVSVCWLPFVLLFFLKIKSDNRIRNSIFGGITLSLMITGGYPAFVIILFYLFGVFFVVYTVDSVKHKTSKAFYLWLSRIGLFVLIAIICSSGLFFSIYLVQPYLSRLNGFTIENALFSPFSIQSFISFIAPYATSLKSDIFNSDLSMRNGYFGLIPFIFFILSIFSKKSSDLKILFWFSLFCLTASVGDLLPVRTFLFDHIPMMNLFRFPSVFRGFFILISLLVGLNFLTNLDDNKIKQLKNSVLVFIGIFFCIVIITRMNGYLNFSYFINNDIHSNEETVTIAQHLVLSSILSISLLLVFLAAIIKKRNILKWSLILLIVDCFITIQLVGPFTVYSPEFNLNEITDNFNRKTPSKINYNNITIKEIDHLQGIGSPFWKNEGMLQELLTSKGFNSFSFTEYENLENNFPNYFDKLIQNKIFLLSDTIFKVEFMSKFEADTSKLISNFLFFDEKEFKMLSLKKFHSDFQEDKVVVVQISPQLMKFNINIENQQLFTIFQKNFKGWKVYINGEKTIIYTSSKNFMTIVLPKGKNEVVFEYDLLRH